MSGDKCNTECERIRSLQKDFVGKPMSDGQSLRSLVDEEKEVIARVKLARECLDEYDMICCELLNHLASLWWAFDPKDSRAKTIRELCRAYESRRCAVSCGVPDPELTEEVNDLLRGGDDEALDEGN